MRRLPALGTVVAALLVQAPAPTAEPGRGVVLLSVRQGSTADQAGLRPGDVLHRWRRASSTPAGGLSSSFDWVEMFLEQVPRGSVELSGSRDGRKRIWVLPGGAPSAVAETEVRPVLPRDLLALFERGRERETAGDLTEALRLWQSAAALARARGDEGIGRWLTARRARRLAGASRGEEADPLYQGLTDAFAATPAGTAAAAQLFREWAESLRQRELWPRAAAADRHALELDRRASPESLAAAWSLTGLAYTASWSAGSQDSDRFFREALALRQRLAPGCADIAESWWDRGNDAMSSGLYGQARDRYRRAASLMERAAPESIYLAEVLASLGSAESLSGDLEAAGKSWRRGLRIAETWGEEDQVTAALVEGLGGLAMQGKKWPEAVELFGRSLAFSGRLTNNPIDRADILIRLASAERRLGRKLESARHSCQAMEISEAERLRFPSPETQLRWGEKFTDHYRACALALVDQGESEKAFDALERGRARSFLALLVADRRPVKLGAPEAAAWRKLDAEYDRIEAELADLRQRPGGEPEAIYSREGRLREIQYRKNELTSRSAPGTARRPPPPLDLAAVAGSLDPGTALLSYATMPDATLLFVVASGDGKPPSLAVLELPVGLEALQRQVEAFRGSLIENRFREAEGRRQGSALYDLLLRPAEALLAPSERLLIVPDGPLHLLPFGALVKSGHFLAEDKPMHFATSATADAEIRKRRRPAGDPARLQILAFGDPLQPASAAARAAGESDPALREALRRGLAPLPAARQEVWEIAHLFPRTRSFLGAAATEERAKQEAGKAAFLHFAVHAMLDERMPANSALVMSPPPKGNKESGNGLLQGWEILEDLHLDADLVTLSACDTALGTNKGGEGLIGLTRAFQSAGARSVLATLWGISDLPSAELMKRFYAALRGGKSKDEALREAQIELLGRREGREPFYWASFQLYGDWR